MNNSAISPRDAEYLLAILRLGGDKKHVGPSEVSGVLGISRVSSREKMLVLAEKGMGKYVERRGFLLSKEGVRVAKEILFRHRVVEAFLRNTLDLSAVDACREARRFDIFVSDFVIEKIVERWKPVKCPCDNIREA
mgnify:CR=1 FL=1